MKVRKKACGKTAYYDGDFRYHYLLIDSLRVQHVAWPSLLMAVALPYQRISANNLKMARLWAGLKIFKEGEHVRKVNETAF